MRCRLLARWFEERQKEDPLVEVLVAAAYLAWLVGLLCFLAVAGAAVWAHFRGGAGPLNLALKAAFWAGAAGAGLYLAAVVSACQVDLAAERRRERRRGLTLREILGRSMDFERWCG
jgi:hypothetical protein